MDCRKLNIVPHKDNNPFPWTNNSLNSLGTAKYFSTLDLASCYWQVGLTASAQEKSAFCTPRGLYQFHVMLFRLSTTTFQHLMQRVMNPVGHEFGLPG